MYKNNMKTYIAYKYTNIKNKEQLKQDLNMLSESLTDQGHSTFILGRDKQKWQSVKYPLWETVPAILTNLIKSNLLVAYITGCEKSTGLTFELTFAKLFGKKILLVVNKCNGDFKYDREKRHSDNIIEIENINQIKERLAHEL
jgi:hypothetical protein